jgi:hypothetical protein
MRSIHLARRGESMLLPTVSAIALPVVLGWARWADALAAWVRESQAGRTRRAGIKAHLKIADMVRDLAADDAVRICDRIKEIACNQEAVQIMTLVPEAEDDAAAAIVRVRNDRLVLIAPVQPATTRTPPGR